MSVMHYIHNYRLDKSADLLLATELSITEIMERTGLYNESSYYKRFKRRFGTTPKVYRVDKEILNKLEKLHAFVVFFSLFLSKSILFFNSYSH
ncbi:helix-turn-helix domain-containing protein [Paenibacillus roseipurpureus]|uniref:Helix-turn-helix domain-containing protein n=1 Tax=Paenibacillus roseopurpureus TaxID=2918901 RepID=A0AA96LN77_9BACL|nr:helix-turn-helix domain-containing protein [Paenibacillus sp. MBLB1832]WNR42823.1 helix-turn-helix domain-containing protein [Paenibacillus sp. MBLB1832]